MPLMDYGPEWRFHRKLVRTALSPEAVKKYRPLQEQLAVLMAQLFLERPAEFDNHIRLYAPSHVLPMLICLSAVGPRGELS